MPPLPRLAAARATPDPALLANSEDEAGPSSLAAEPPSSTAIDLSDLEPSTPSYSPPLPEPEEFSRVRKVLIEEFADLFQPVPPELPPFRAINHTIPIIDEAKRYNYHLPRCPEVLRSELKDKIDRYVAAGWWEPRAVSQAAPLLCVYKKDGRLRTVVDLRQRNDNTVRDVTPFPDQDQIRNDVARARFRSKLDMSDAYEQTRIADEDVPKTGFATIFGTYVSRVMQQGD